MSDQLVRRTLQRDVLPYLLSARRLRRQWFYRLHFVFGYATDLIAAFAAVGVATPLLSLLGTISETPNRSVLPSLATSLKTLPAWLFYPAAVVVIVWIVLRVAFNREEGQKRAVLAKSCTRILRGVEVRLAHALTRADPMPAITELLETDIRPSVDRNIQEDAWPWTPFAPEIDDEVARELEVLCKRYERDWARAGPADIRVY